MQEDARRCKKISKKRFQEEGASARKIAHYTPTLNAVLICCGGQNLPPQHPTTTHSLKDLLKPRISLGRSCGGAPNFGKITTTAASRSAAQPGKPDTHRFERISRTTVRARPDGDCTQHAGTYLLCLRARAFLTKSYTAPIVASTVKLSTISSLLVVRYLERIADHATYIGESIAYLATGEKVTLR